MEFYLEQLEEFLKPAKVLKCLLNNYKILKIILLNALFKYDTKQINQFAKKSLYFIYSDKNFEKNEINTTLTYRNSPNANMTFGKILVCTTVSMQSYLTEKFRFFLRKVYYSNRLYSIFPFSDK